MSDLMSIAEGICGDAAGQDNVTCEFSLFERERDTIIRNLALCRGYIALTKERIKTALKGGCVLMTIESATYLWWMHAMCQCKSIEDVRNAMYARPDVLSMDEADKLGLTYEYCCNDDEILSAQLSKELLSQKGSYALETVTLVANLMLNVAGVRDKIFFIPKKLQVLYEALKEDGDEIGIADFIHDFCIWRFNSSVQGITNKTEDKRLRDGERPNSPTLNLYKSSIRDVSEEDFNNIYWSIFDNGRHFKKKGSSTTFYSLTRGRISACAMSTDYSKEISVTVGEVPAGTIVMQDNGKPEAYFLNEAAVSALWCVLESV